MEGLKLENLFHPHLGIAQESFSGEDTIGDVKQSSQNKIKGRGSWGLFNIYSILHQANSTAGTDYFNHPHGKGRGTEA